MPAAAVAGAPVHGALAPPALAQIQEMLQPILDGHQALLAGQQALQDGQQALQAGQQADVVLHHNNAILT